MCCPGCAAVAEAICSSGLDDYYRFRSDFAAQGDTQLAGTLDKLSVFDHADIQDEFVVDSGNKQTIQLSIDGISCAACGWLIEKQLAKIEGILQVAVNVSARRATISWDPQRLKLSQILASIEQIGYHALPFEPDQHERLYQHSSKTLLKKLGLAGLMTMQVMMLAIGLYFGLFGDIEPDVKQYFHWLSLLLTTPVVVYAGSGFFVSAWNALKARFLNMDVSVSLAILGTYLASGWATVTGDGDIYFESVCMFVFLLLVSRYLEQRSRYRSAQASANMLKHIPVSATIVEGSEQRLVLAKHLTIGQQVLVKAGETVPIDGIIHTGHSDIDESMLSGEFEPVSKSQGDPVFGGTVNQQSPLIITVSKTLKNALVNQIIRMQELAMAQKPAIAHFADRTSRHFIALVLIIAAASYIAWQWIDPQQAFWILIAVLVATCPCALSLATPTALTCAVARLNRHGLLIKRADVLEQVLDVKEVVLDKTGTLTKGHFSLSHTWQCADIPKDRLLQIATSLEQVSEHPLSKGFNHPVPLPVSSVTVVPGGGIEGTVDGITYRIGNCTFAGQDCGNDYVMANVFLSANGVLLGAFSLTDEIRDNAQAFVDSLAPLPTTLLSGDREAQAIRVAKTLGIDTVLWQQSPDQKVSYVTQQQRKHPVMMMGDGINDAPVLAAASVSIAMGNAADMAKRSADVVLLGDNLPVIADLFSTARDSRRIIKQNMAWALGYNVVILPLAVCGLLTPWLAVIGMSLSSILVVSNSTRLLKERI